MTSSVFFNHSRHLLKVRKLEAQLDVLTFTGQEHLSQPFTYCVEFTSTERDLAADRLLGRSGQDAVWNLQSSHKVVEQQVQFRSYHHREAYAYLSGEVDQTRAATTTYGEAYHYAEPYTALGDQLDQDEDLLSESGYFYSRLRHERYLNGQTQLSGVSSSATLAPGQVLKVTGGAPEAFVPRAVNLVDAGRQKRGEGFELRTDGWGAIRGGSGIFISADAQPKAQGQMLEMSAALGRLEQAGEQLQGLSVDARAANADPADVQAQLNLLTQNLEQLKSSVVLLSATHGVAVTSGQHLQLIARHGLSITSTEDEIHITAKKKITLNAGGSYITLDQSSIVAGTQGDHLIKSAYFDFLGPAQQVLDKPQPPQLTEHESESLKLSVFSG